VTKNRICTNKRVAQEGQRAEKVGDKKEDDALGGVKINYVTCICQTGREKRANSTARAEKRVNSDENRRGLEGPNLEKGEQSGTIKE